MMTLHFIRPHWFWLYLPAVVYLLWLMKSMQESNPWKAVCDEHLLKALAESDSAHPKKLFYAALALFYALAIFALAGPAWHKASLPLYREVNTTMLVLDLSSAMSENDIKPDRLSRAKFKIRDLIANANNTQMGLVAFTEEAFTASPLSQDANTLSALVDELNTGIMPVDGSDSGQGLAEGYQLLKQAGANLGNVLLMTASAPTANSWRVAKNIAEQGGHVSVYAILENNAANQSLLHDLQQLAQTGNGTFTVFTNDATDIKRIIQSTDSKHVTRDEKMENAFLWSDAGPWVCLALVPIVLFVLRENKPHEKS